MLGQLSGPMLIVLDADGRGIAIVDGVSLRVECAGRSERLARHGDEPGRRIFLELSVTTVLDEKQQCRKIARLESQLADEREWLAAIRQAEPR